MSIYRKLSKTLCIVLAAVLVFGAFCTFGAEEGAEEAEKQTVKIGIVTAFSGPSARSGETQLLGLQIALDEIEESGYCKYYDFELLIGDDQYDATEAVAVANKLVYQDGIQAVFGHLNAVVSLAALPTYEEAGIPAFVPSGSAADAFVNDRYEYAYLVNSTSAVDAGALTKYLTQDLGLTKLGLFYSNNEQGQSGLNNIEKAMANLGMELTAKESYAVGDTDFTGQLLSFKQAGIEALMIWGGEATQRAIIVPQARQLIGPDVVISGESVFTNSSYITATQPEERAGIIFIVPWSSTFTDERSQNFVKTFTERDSLNQTPSAVAVRFYDGMYLLATALNNLGPYDVTAKDFTEKLNQAVKESSYDGLQGTLKPDEYGLCIKGGYVCGYDENGEEQLLATVDTE